MQYPHFTQACRSCASNAKVLGYIWCLPFIINTRLCYTIHTCVYGLHCWAYRPRTYYLKVRVYACQVYNFHSCVCKAIQDIQQRSAWTDQFHVHLAACVYWRVISVHDSIREGCLWVQVRCIDFRIVGMVAFVWVRLCMILKFLKVHMLYVVIFIVEMSFIYEYSFKMIVIIIAMYLWIMIAAII